jgi:large subunit ribosomal protein L22
MIVKEAYVDGAVTMKRVMPAPMGRAYRVRKRSNHVTIVVASGAGGAAQVPGESTRTRAARAPKKAQLAAQSK